MADDDAKERRKRAGGRQQGEGPKERLDRELMELLNEIRVALPGAQVLFAFLLTVPFAGRFRNLSDFQRDTYFVAFIASAVAVALLLAPTAHHRLRWRKYDKERLLQGANAMTIIALAVLVIAMGAVVLLISDVMFGARAAGVIAGVITMTYIGMWFGIPVIRIIQDRGSGRND